MEKINSIVISLGGSLIVPNGGIDTKFISEFNTYIRNKIAKNWRFFIVVGGGSTARHYIEAAKVTTGSISDWDLDWLGIHATRLNAHLIKTVFQGVVHPRIIHDYYKLINNLNEKVIIAAGGKPGWSTDYDAVILARDYKVGRVINMSNIDCVYDKDPHQYSCARPLHQLTWSELEKMVGDKWKPGSNLPFDPIATKLAKKLELKVYVIGKDIKNLDRVIEGEKFCGTEIS
ncbi:aspartate kinase [Candidatus Gottesmanbacteria bacterium RBG_13_37_7]|uniref:Uridylate kinase n=1 Tax=Candidatus Gottesmanbacteria bacterium RBG_13_37_7 TaxID=1798369 RepID=A0A1F5YGG5_9BACT|nr:MAG: aspartate kinase [Candidatus Gottesmanbacteria bacterium RBG_13_37_7]